MGQAKGRHHHPGLKTGPSFAISASQPFYCIVTAKFTSYSDLVYFSFGSLASIKP